MRVIVIMTIFLLLSKISHGQSNLIDSLKLNIENNIQNKDYTAAISETLKYKTEIENLYSKISSNYLYVLDCLYVLYDATKQYKLAEICLNESESILRLNAGILNIKYANNISQLGVLYKDMGEVDLSENRFLLADSIYKTIQDYSEANINNLDNLGWLYYETEKYKKSINIYNRILDIYENRLNKNDNEDYRRVLVVLGKNFLAIGDAKTALKYFENSYSLLKNSSNENKTALINTSSLMGLAFSKIDDFNNSEKFYKISLENSKMYTPNDSLGLAIIFNNLGLLYKEKGSKDKAIEYLLESIEIRKKMKSTENLDYSYTLSNLGMLYLDLENVNSARVYQTEATNIIKKIYGENSIKYAGMLNNLGHCYEDEYEKAKNIYLKAEEIQLKLLGNNNPDYSVTLNNLGNVYSSLKNYSAAEKYFKKSLKIQLSIYGETHHLYITTIQNLGQLYFYSNKIDSSEKYLLTALKLKRNLWGENDASLISNKELLTLLYLKKGDTTLAKKYIDEAVTSSYNIIINSFYYLTDKEKMPFLNKYDNIYNLYNSIFIESKNEGFAKIFDLSMFNKGIVLRNSSLIEQKAKINKDSIYFNLKDSIIDIKYKLSNFYIRNNIKSNISIEELNDKLYKQERFLTRHVSRYLNTNENMKYTWRDVRSKLKKDEVAIEIISFNQYNNNKWIDSTLYIAMILKANYNEPKLITLFEERKINIFLKSNSPETLNDIYKNSEIYTLFWGNISKYLNDNERIFISPSGLLNNYNFKAQILSNGQLVGEKYKIHLLNSIEEILTYEEVSNIKDNVSSIYLYGGVDYGNNQIRNTSLSENMFSNRSSLNYNWPFLSYSLIEASTIDSLVKDSKIKSHFYYGNDAKEETFKEIGDSKSNNIIHVATHGYFIKKSSNDSYKIANNANTTYNSGLIFSNANEYQINIADNQLITNDGNLTTIEISNINLAFCKLLVLSACETGIGEIEGNEGVFGLRRAFKMAGVKNIISSLWKVPDIQTSELMYIFYKNLLQGNSISDALFNAQLKMSKKYPPYYWASFTLLE